MVVVGCGESTAPDSEVNESDPPVNESTQAAIQVKSLRGNSNGDGPATVKDETVGVTDQAPPDKPKETPIPKPRQGLAALLEGDDSEFKQNRMAIDRERVKTSGIRAIDGEYITIYTDLREEKYVEELADVFDQAVPQWCEYFQVDIKNVENWKLSGFIIEAPDRFRNAGLLPDNLPEFKHAFTRGSEFWVYNPTQEYYLRHQVLHEGTHAFMFHFLGGAGPPWYSEGMAELMACHRWELGQLTLKYSHLDSKDCSGWRRIELIREVYDKGEAQSIGNVFLYDWNAHIEIEPYAWCWAACAFFDSHPKFHDAFKSMVKKANDRSPTFNVAFMELLRPSWNELVEQWQLFISEMDYGYDVKRAMVVYQPGDDLPAAGKTVDISVDQGWQSTGILLEAGVEYQLAARGRFQLDDEPKIWWSDPKGVTIHYYRGKPIGLLIAAVRPDSQADESSALLTKIPIGTGRVIVRPDSGTLYLKINESPAHLDDNRGNVQVNIRAK